MKYITGAPTVHGNTIVVSFGGASATPAGVTVNTCGREIRLSPGITEESRFCQDMFAVIGEYSFTMT